MPEILISPPRSQSQSGLEPVQHETKSATNSHVGPSGGAPHDSLQESVANVSSVDAPVVLQDSAEEAVQHSVRLWAACGGAMAELASRIGKLPDSKTRDDLQRRLRECSATRDKAAQTAHLIARRAAIAKYSLDGVKLDRQRLMKLELERANTQDFQTLQKQMRELNDAVCKAHMPTGPLKVAIGTLIAATLAMLAAALASLVVPPLMVAAVAGGVALAGTGSIACLAVSSWRNDSKALAELQTEVAATGSELQSLINEAVASRRQAIEHFEAAAIPALQARAEQVGMAAARRLMEVSVGDAEAAFRKDDTWDGAQYSFDGEALVLSEAELAELKDYPAAQRWVDDAEGRLAALGEPRGRRMKKGKLDKLAPGELAVKRDSALNELNTARQNLDEQLRPAYRRKVEGLIEQKSKGDSIVQHALYHALSSAPRDCLLLAMTGHLRARIGLDENALNAPMIRAQEEPVAHTDVRLEGDGSVTARVTVIVPVRADGDVGIVPPRNATPAPVPAAEVMRGEAVLRIEGERCTVTSLDIDVSDGMLKVASDACAADIRETLLKSLDSGGESVETSKPVAPNDGASTFPQDIDPARATAIRQSAPRLSGLAGSALLFAFATSSDASELLEQCRFALPLLVPSTVPSEAHSPVESAADPLAIQQEAHGRATDLVAWADEQLQQLRSAYSGWRADDSSQNVLAEGNQRVKRLLVLRAALLQAERRLLSREECEKLMHCFAQGNPTAEQLGESLAMLVRSSDISAKDLKDMQPTLRQKLDMVDKMYGQLDAYLKDGTPMPDTGPASAAGKPAQPPGRVTALV